MTCSWRPSLIHCTHRASLQGGCQTVQWRLTNCWRLSQILCPYRVFLQCGPFYVKWKCSYGWRPFHTHCTCKASPQSESTRAAWGVTCSKRPSHTLGTYKASLQCEWCSVEWGLLCPKGFFTFLAFKGSHSTMNLLVPPEVWPAVECLPTLHAHEGFLSHVDDVVLKETSLILADFPTFYAHRVFCQCGFCYAESSWSGGCVGLSTLNAHTGLLPSVDLVVPHEVWPAVEGLPALHALIGSLPDVDHMVLKDVMCSC